MVRDASAAGHGNRLSRGWKAAVSTPTGERHWPARRASTAADRRAPAVTRSAPRGDRGGPAPATPGDARSRCRRATSSPDRGQRRPPNELSGQRRDRPRSSSHNPWRGDWLAAMKAMTARTPRASTAPRPRPARPRTECCHANAGDRIGGRAAEASATTRQMWTRPIRSTRSTTAASPGPSCSTGKPGTTTTIRSRVTARCPGPAPRALSDTPRPRARGRSTRSPPSGPSRSRTARSLRPRRARPTSRRAGVHRARTRARRPTARSGGRCSRTTR